MRKREPVVPNLVATVRFVGAAKDEKIILHGPDAPTVEGRLRRRYPGIQVKSAVAYDFAAGWGEKARTRKLAIETAIEANQKYDFNKNSIWTELKDFLFDLFDGNCAYCECSLLAGSFGAVEHYRPKNPVADVPGHPGYYWLAYDEKNYLPTCTRCNTSKSNLFPLAKRSPRAAKPGDEAGERPLLLNPYRDIPVEHLMFVAADSKNPTGGQKRAGGQQKVGPVAKGITEEGKESVRLLNLNRPDVLTERLKEQQLAAQDYWTQRNAGIRPIPVLEQLKAGARPFSAAALVAVTFLDQGFPELG